MRIRLTRFSIVGSAVLALASCQATTGPRTVSFGDAFGPNALGSYTAYSDSGFPWSVRPGVMRGDGVGLQSVLIRNDVRIADGWVEVLVDSVDDGGLVLRFSDNDHYYLLTIRDDESPPPRNVDNLQIYRRSGPGQAGFTSLWRRDVIWPRGLQRRVRFEAAGESLIVYLDGEPMGVVNDAGGLSGEGIGMRHYGNSTEWTTRYREFRWKPKN